MNCQNCFIFTVSSSATVSPYCANKESNRTPVSSRHRKRTLMETFDLGWKNIGEGVLFKAFKQCQPVTSHRLSNSFQLYINHPINSSLMVSHQVIWGLAGWSSLNHFWQSPENNVPVVHSPWCHEHSLMAFSKAPSQKSPFFVCCNYSAIKVYYVRFLYFKNDITACFNVQSVGQFALTSFDTMFADCILGWCV